MLHNPALVEAVLPAAVLGAVCLLAMALVLRWWRGRLVEDDADSADMRARIAAAAPDPCLPRRDQADPGPRDGRGLSSTFVGRDYSAVPLD
jgi:hypothetical protein